MEKRTLAVQVTEELFQRVKWAVTKEGIKQKDFLIRIIEKALGTSEYKLTEKQEKERNGSRSLFVVKDIRAGEKLTPENVRSIRPAYGLHTMYYEEVLGKTATRDLEMGTPLAWDMIER